MAPEVEALADFFEREMVKERVDDEVRERRNLEKSFESWSRKTSTGGLEESNPFLPFIPFWCILVLRLRKLN